MFPLALPAVLGMSKGKWIALGVGILIVLAIIGGLTAWLMVAHADLRAAEAKVHALETVRDFYRADATRWQSVAAEQVKVNAANIAAFEAARADLARSAASAIEAAQQAESAAAASAAQLAKLRSKANATPGDVRPLGPVVRDGLEWLRCRQQAGAGADPAACAGAVRAPAD